MVLGIGEGSLELSLDRQAYSPGETINGKAVLRLNSPKAARALRLDFFRETTRTSMRKGKRSRRTERTMITSKELSSQKVFNPGEEFPFDLYIPDGIVQPLQQPGEGLGGALLAAASLLATPPVTRFFVSASLDSPMQLDISKCVEIQVMPKQAGV